MVVTFCPQHVLSYVNAIKHVKRKSHLLHAYIQQFESQNPNLFMEFQDLVENLAENDPNWINFIFRDLFSCYIIPFYSRWHVET